MTRRIRFTLTALTIGLCCATAASAAETITYTYDARGRVIKVVHTGTVNNNVQACYKYDKAGNRQNVKIDVGSLPACP